MMHEYPKLTTPRGSWTFSQLSEDPFGLIGRAKTKNHLVLPVDKPEEIVSAVFVADDQIPIVYLGKIDEPRIIPSNSATLWVFLTSGSTGHPKQIPHKLDSITRNMPHHEKAQSTWGFFTDITKMAGFQVVLEAVSRGENLVVPDAEMSIVAKANFIKENGVTHLSATPSQFRQFLSVPGVSSLPLKQITLGGEIADQKILHGLKSAFPESKITHVYATTETGPVFSVSDGRAGFPKTQLSKPTNRIVLSELNEVGITGSVNNQVHWTGDLVELDKDRFVFAGRNSDVINVGGAKVNPATVESVILAHSDVQDCIVKGRESSVLGNLVVADIVLNKANPAVAEELRGLCREFLPKHAVPRIFTIVEEIRQSTAGKKVRE